MNKRLATFLVLVLSFPVFGEAQQMPIDGVPYNLDVTTRVRPFVGECRP